MPAAAALFDVRLVSGAVVVAKGIGPYGQGVTGAVLDGFDKERRHL